jgi:hypothetical protein
MKMKNSTLRLTPAQKKALGRYEFCLREEDRYFGSVFVNAVGSRKQEAKTKVAYDECVRLGMTWKHGL